MTREQPENWRRAKPVVWLKAIMPVTLPAGGKAVAAALAMHADKRDGTNARPGLSRLEWASGASRKTVTATLDNLEAMWLLRCASKSTGRGNANVYELTLHDEIGRLGMSFEDWQRERRPADSTRKGLPGKPFRGERGGPLPAAADPIKGFRDGDKGFPVPAQRVSRETAPGSSTREDLTSSVLADGRSAARGAIDEDLSGYEIESDPADLEALEEELGDLLYADAVEMSTITGMLQDGRHPKAIINTILAWRR